MVSPTRAPPYEHFPRLQLCLAVAILCMIASLQAGHRPLVLLTLFWQAQAMLFTPSRQSWQTVA